MKEKIEGTRRTESLHAHMYANKKEGIITFFANFVFIPFIQRSLLKKKKKWQSADTNIAKGKKSSQFWRITV